MADRAVYLVDGVRTPFLKAKNEPGPFRASDLATRALQMLLMRQRLDPAVLDEVILGCAAPRADEVNIGRVVALRAGCGRKVPGWTVMRNCASGMQAIDSAAAQILSGRADLIAAGGVDALSHAPVLFSDEFVRFLGRFAAAKSPAQKLAALRQLRLRDLKLVIGLMKGLTDPVVKQLMGQTAETLATRFGITREEMDAFAVESHRRAAAAHEAGHFAHEMTPLFDAQGRFYAHDDGVRPDSSLEKLAKLKPFFDRYGRVTPGNSSQITDGATMLLVASEAAVKRYRLEPVARLVDTHWAGLDPAQMGLGPVHAATPLLQRAGWALDDVDFWEINEAFAAQVLACLKAWESDDYCRSELGLPMALGPIDRSRLNVDGGAIALGHPVGASGARIVWHLVEVLQRHNAKRGIAAICIGGGLGGAMRIERL